MTMPAEINKITAYDTIVRVYEHTIDGVSRGWFLKLEYGGVVSVGHEQPPARWKAGARISHSVALREGPETINEILIEPPPPIVALAVTDTPQGEVVGYFAWVAGPNGVTATKYNRSVTELADRHFSQKAIRKYPLDAAQWEKPLSVLAELYPAPSQHELARPK